MPDPSSRPVADGRVSIGNSAIDTMLSGGLVPHRPYLIVGPSGTGKTKLALQFLCEGIRRGERVLLVTLEEPPNEIRHNHRSLEPELDRVEVFDAIPDIMRYERTPFKDIASVRQITPFQEVPPEIRRSPELASVEVTITALEQMLRSEVVRRGYSRIVIDSLTALQYFCMKGFDPVGGAQTFLRFLSDLKTTSLLTVESPLEDVETTERTLARGEIRLFRWELDGVTVRAIGVEKMRGSAHDVRLHPYRIGPHGIDVNLSVTISRDTREIVEAVPVPTPAARPSLAPLYDEVRDLIALGIDPGPVRGTVETALAAARAGRTDVANQAIARLSAQISSLAATVARAPSSAGEPASPTADAHRRLAQRAESSRVGLPPTLLPSPDLLEQQLGRVLTLLPPPGAAPTAESPASPPAAAPVVSAAPDLVSETPAQVPTRAPAVATVAAPASPPEPAPKPAEPIAARTPSETPVRETPSPRAVPTRVRSAPPTAVPAMPEPPPLPRSMPRPEPEHEPGRRSVPAPPPSPSPPPADTAGSPTHPPLPVVSLPPESPQTPAPATVSAAAPEPVQKRRRRTTTPSRKKAASAAPEEAAPPALPAPAEGETPAPESKPKRRAVRKRKAPPVVAATPEPLPAPEPTGSAPPGPASPPPEGE